jgi:glycosyltransferase involved in cell wall biosynthesis
MVHTAPIAPWTDFPDTGTQMASHSPLITIAVPAYNRPGMLAETLASIAAQTATVPLEVIVCDDGRLPQTRVVFERFRRDGYRYQSNPVTLGAVANWNRCLALARGKFVMVLHEDDILYPWYLESILPRLEDGSAAVCMRTSRGRVPPKVRCPQGGELATAYPPRYFLKSSMSPFPGVLVRRDVALRLGGFDERWGPIADYEFWYRLACAGRIDVIGAVGAFYRVAPGQWTERIWGRMLRLTHLLRLRIAREQFPGNPRASRWAARFFTYRNAVCYSNRFGRGSGILQRCLGLGRVPLSGVPAGWVWRALKFASGAEGRHLEFAPDAGRTPQIQPGSGRPDRVAA